MAELLKAQLKVYQPDSYKNSKDSSTKTYMYVCRTSNSTDKFKKFNLLTILSILFHAPKCYWFRLIMNQLIKTNLCSFNSKQVKLQTMLLFNIVRLQLIQPIQTCMYYKGQVKTKVIKLNSSKSLCAT